MLSQIKIALGHIAEKNGLRRQHVACHVRIRNAHGRQKGQADGKGNANLLHALVDADRLDAAVKIGVRAVEGKHAHGNRKSAPGKKRRKQQASHGHGQRLVVHVRDFLVQKRQHLRFELCHLLHVGGKRRNPAGLVLFKPDDTAKRKSNDLREIR